MEANMITPVAEILSPAICSHFHTTSVTPIPVLGEAGGLQILIYDHPIIAQSLFSSWLAQQHVP